MDGPSGHANEESNIRLVCDGSTSASRFSQCDGSKIVDSRSCKWSCWRDSWCWEASHQLLADDRSLSLTLHACVHDLADSGARADDPIFTTQCSEYQLNTSVKQLAVNSIDQHSGESVSSGQNDLVISIEVQT